MLNVFSRAKYVSLTNSSPVKTKDVYFNQPVRTGTQSIVVVGRALLVAGTPKDVTVKARLIYKDNAFLSGSNLSGKICDKTKSALGTINITSLSVGEAVDFAYNVEEIGDYKVCVGIELEFKHSNSGASLEVQVEAGILLTR